MYCIFHLSQLMSPFRSWRQLGSTLGNTTSDTLKHWMTQNAFRGVQSRGSLLINPCYNSVFHQLVPCNPADTSIRVSNERQDIFSGRMPYLTLQQENHNMNLLGLTKAILSEAASYTVFENKQQQQKHLTRPRALVVM